MMKAIRLVAWLPLLFVISCGQGIPPLNAPTPTNPILFMYIVGQNSQSIFGFQLSSAEVISPLAPSSTGTTLQPAAVLVHPGKNFLYVANFGSSDITKYSRNPTTGVITPLGSIPPTPTGVGPVALATDSKGQFLYCLNQGSSTSAPSISAFSVDTTHGVLIELTGSPFATIATPTAFAVSQSSNFIYVANGTAGTISAFSMGSDGTLTAVPGSPFPAAGVTPNLGAIAVDPKGRFVYAADSANSVVIGFAIQSNGALSALSNSPFPIDGANPLGLAIEATGTFLFVGDEQTTPFSTLTTGSISVLTIASSGSITPIAESPFTLSTTAAAYVTIDPSNMFLFNTNPINSNVTGFSFNAQTGILTQLVDTPIGVTDKPAWIALSN